MVLAGALAAAAGAGVAWWRWTPKASSPQELDAFWAQRFAQPAGGELDLQSFRGKPLLVNFWATWCPPCVEELPMIDAFSREHAAKGLQVLALAIDQPSAVRRFLERQALSFPVGLAGLGVPSWPGLWAMPRVVCLLVCFSRQMAAFIAKNSGN